MPCVEGLAIRRGNGEWRYLALRESELLTIMDVLPEERVDFMGIQGAARLMSECSTLGIIVVFTIVAREVSAEDQ